MADDDDPRREDIATWVRRHQVRVWRFARLCGCPPDVADDLVQEALMAAVHKNIPHQPEARATAWLRRAVENLWRMHLRSEGRRARNVDTALAARALHQCAAQDDGADWLQALRTCLGGLDGRARQLLDLHYRDGLSRDTVATTLGMSTNGVKAFLRRVRGSLRDCVLRRLRLEEATDR